MKLLSELKYSVLAVFIATFFAVPLESKATYLIDGTSSGSTTNGYTSSNSSSPATFGFKFTTGTTALTIYALGEVDLNGLGLPFRNGPVPVGIWDTNGTLLGSVNVTGTEALVQTDTISVSGYAGTGFRYEPLATPITLSVNTTYTLGAYNGYTLSAIPAANIITSGGVTVGVPVIHNGGTGLTFATSTVPSYSDILGPNASFSPVPAPEPGNFVAIALAGVFTVAFMQRRRKFLS